MWAKAIHPHSKVFLLCYYKIVTRATKKKLRVEKDTKLPLIYLSKGSIINFYQSPTITSGS